MTKIIIALVGIALLVGAYFMFVPRGVTESVQGDAPSTADAPVGKKMAFSEFMKQGGSYACTINQTIQGQASQGTAFVSDGMIRGKFTTQMDGASVDTNLIVRDGYTYMWSSMAPGMGFKVKAAGDGASPAQGSLSFDADAVGDYDCQPWDRDDAQFTIPTSVKFTEMGV